MIERYSDHAANERTFLAWVRTAVAIMGFGFLVEKFDLFVKVAGGTVHQGSQLVGNIAGLALFILGGAMMVLAVVRFRQTSTAIDADERHPAVGARMDMALVTLLVLLGAVLFGFLVYTTVPADRV
jgi:putative membrane protein